VDSASANLEREIRRRRCCLEEGGDSNNRVHDVSDGHENAGARVSQAAGWARPKREAGEEKKQAARGKGGRGVLPGCC
jgi:hypothetical protein